VKRKLEYDIVVIGGGHAGCEAAAAAARLGSSVLMISMDLGKMAHMSCNPSMGGVAKGQIVREIDALGGLSGIVTDKTMIQFRMLNRSKGPAMWSPRAQSDRVEFSAEWRRQLEAISNLDFLQDSVGEILVKNDLICGVKTKFDNQIDCKSVIVCSGTFLNGIIHIGELKFEGGRIGDPSEKNLTNSLRRLGFESDRMKTGTPVRVDGRSIDFSKLIEQKGDEDPGAFSFITEGKIAEQRSCWLAYTSPEVHDILKTGFDKSPMFQGRIKGIGPRYCPSIEDKIERFSHRERHQLFVEPEGRNSIEYYINGFSSSLPAAIQIEALQKIEGFKNAKVFRPGYAIEYDYFPPVQLGVNLETKVIRNLFFAGQINGTTGYEEAAAQGLMAGVNAHQNIKNKRPFLLKRSEAYIGVLIDDLITKGVDEPYRMFTSRAEYRLLLRQDNADARLTLKGAELGLASKERLGRFLEKSKRIENFCDSIRLTKVRPEEINKFLMKTDTPQILQRTSLIQILLRPQVFLKDVIRETRVLGEYLAGEMELNKDEIEEVEILIKYQSYIEKESEIAEKLSRLEDIELHPNFDYHKLQSLSYEAREKLSKIKPATIGQASRIAGVSPADISVLLVFLRR
jgi:tRNA uridine 5-carboxymethylaminomethyl modification enzyme